MCEIGRRRDGAGCAEGCDARARAIGRDARACAACVETASNGVRSSRWTSNRRLSIELLCWQGVWCTHESRPKSATTLFAEEHRSYTATTAITARGSRTGARGTGVELNLTISEFLFAEISLCDETPSNYWPNVQRHASQQSDAQSTSTRSESLSKYEFDQSEGRLFVVGKKSNIMIANFYISQIIAIYTNASAEVGVHRGWIFAPSGWAVETHLPNAPTACPELTCLSSASPT